MSGEGQKPELSLDTRVRQASAQVHVSIQESTVILSLDRNTYFSLNEIGSVLWGLMAEPVSLRDCCGHILERYEVEPSRCQDEVLTLARDLIAAGLVVTA